MDGVISTPIALAGLFLIPDLPENSRAFYLSRKQIQLAQERMDDVGRKPRSELGWSAWKRIFGRWHVYLLVVLYIVFINTVSLFSPSCRAKRLMLMDQGPSTSVNPLSLWLKAEDYSVALVNVIPTTQYAMQALCTVLFAVCSDYLRNRPAIMSVSTSVGLFCSVILAVWQVPAGLKWFAFEMTRASVPYGPISMSWAK